MPIKKADSAWKKIIARMSTVWPTRGENTIDVTTTPEGFNWVYRKFVKELAANPSQRPLYGIVHASTRQTARLWTSCAPWAFSTALNSSETRRGYE